MRQLATVYGTATAEYAVLSDASSLASVRHGQRLQVHTHVRLTDGKFVHGQNSVRERHTELGAPT